MVDLNSMLTPEAVNTAMASPGHLKRWLAASGRRWLVLPTADLVDALPWPEGVASVMQLLALWRDHRRTKPSGDTEFMRDEVYGEDVEVPVMYGELLTLPELDRAIRYLISQASELDPKWRLEDAPL